MHPHGCELHSDCEVGGGLGLCIPPCLTTRVALREASHAVYDRLFDESHLLDRSAAQELFEARKELQKAASDAVRLAWDGDGSDGCITRSTTQDKLPEPITEAIAQLRRRRLGALGERCNMVQVAAERLYDAAHRRRGASGRSWPSKESVMKQAATYAMRSDLLGLGGATRGGGADEEEEDAVGGAAAVGEGAGRQAGDVLGADGSGAVPGTGEDASFRVSIARALVWAACKAVPTRVGRRVRAGAHTREAHAERQQAWKEVSKRVDEFKPVVARGILSAAGPQDVEQAVQDAVRPLLAKYRGEVRRQLEAKRDAKARHQGAGVAGGTSGEGSTGEGAGAGAGSGEEAGAGADGGRGEQAAGGQGVKSIRWWRPADVLGASASTGSGGSRPTQAGRGGRARASSQGGQGSGRGMRGGGRSRGRARGRGRGRSRGGARGRGASVQDQSSSDSEGANDY